MDLYWKKHQPRHPNILKIFWQKLQWSQEKNVPKKSYSLKNKIKRFKKKDTDI